MSSISLCENSHNILVQLIDALPTPTLLIDAQQNVVATNSAIQAMLGDAPLQALDQAAPGWRRYLQHGVEQPQQVCVQDDTGRHRVFDIFVQPIDLGAPCEQYVALQLIDRNALKDHLCSVLSTATTQCFASQDEEQFFFHLEQACAKFLCSAMVLHENDATRICWARTFTEQFHRSPAYLAHITDPLLHEFKQQNGVRLISLVPAPVPAPSPEQTRIEHLHTRLCGNQYLALPLDLPRNKHAVLLLAAAGLQPQDITAVAPFAQMLNAALQHTTAQVEHAHERATTAALIHAGRVLAMATTPDEVLRVVCKQALELVGGTTSAIFIAEPDGEYVRCHMAAGQDSDRLLGQRQQLDQIQQGQGLTLQHAPSPALESSDGTATVAAGISQPLCVQQRVIATLLIAHPRTEMISPYQIDALQQFSGTAAVAIENAQLHEAVRRSEERYRTLFQNAFEIVLTLDITGNIIAWNTAALRFLGVSPAELMSQPLNIYDLVSAQTGEQLRRLQTDMLHENTAPSEIELYRPGGSTSILEVTMQVVREAGSPQGMYIIGRDTTERRKLEAVSRQNEKLAALGQLVAGTAHELNNPLAIVLGTTQLLLRDPMATHFIEDVQNIEAAAQRAKQIVSQMRTFAREQHNVRAAVDVQSLIERAFAYQSSRLQHLDARVSVEIAEHTPPIWGDAYQLEQMLDNLLQNAVQAVAERHVPPRTIAVSARPVDNCVQIRITDNGPGIAPDVLPHIFDPFFTTREIGHGTGLGLSLVYGIVEKHGGTVLAESTHGQGATFTVELPAQQSQEELTESLPKEAVNSTILVVEDEPDVRMIVERALTQHGYEVDAVNNSEAALDRVAGKHYDLLITDLRMPGMSGKELFDRLHNRYPHLKWVFITGDTMSAQSEQLMKRGLPFLVKPFTLDDLWDAVATSILGIHSQAA